MVLCSSSGCFGAMTISVLLDCKDPEAFWALQGVCGSGLRCTVRTSGLGAERIRVVFRGL